MNIIHRRLKNLLTALALGVALLGATSFAFADKIYLKDGRVLDGKLVRQDSSFVVFNINGKDEIFDLADVVRVEKTEAKPAETTKPAEPAKATDNAQPAKPSDPAKPAEPAKADGAKAVTPGKAITGKANRIAVINFGMPQRNRNVGKYNIDDLVGGQISVKAWMDIIPMLEADKIDTVVVRINSGGGLSMEMHKFPAVFREYKKRFRLVAWVESAISAAAMSPWIINEFYMLPDGNIGGCTEYRGPGMATKFGGGLEQVLLEMEKLSVEAGRDPLIMRAMQIQQPLSANVDENGRVTFFGDTTSGRILVNGAGKVLTLNALDAVKVKFATAIAATPEELARAMGYQEFEIAGLKASEYMNDYMVRAHRAMEQFVELGERYFRALQAARQLATMANDPRFGTELGKARQALNEMKRQAAMNPNFPFLLGNNIGLESMDDEWFAEQERILRELARTNKEANENAGRNR